jgi:hypothetical protein
MLPAEVVFDDRVTDDHVAEKDRWLVSWERHAAADAHGQRDLDARVARF